MIFWIIIGLCSLAAIVTVFVFILAVFGFFDGEELFAAAFIGTVFFLASIIPPSLIWSDYAADYSTVCKNGYRIEIYEKRIERLENRLNKAKFPSKPNISLDKDSPWATTIAALDNAETQLALAKDEQAKAKRSIFRWEKGPMSGVVTFVGKKCPENR